MVITNVQVTIQKRPGEAGDEQQQQKTFTFTGEGYTVSPADTVMYPRDVRLMDMLNETIKKYNGEIRKPSEYAEQAEGRMLRQRPAHVMPPSIRDSDPTDPGGPHPLAGTPAFVPASLRRHLSVVESREAALSGLSPALTSVQDPTGQGRY